MFSFPCQNNSLLLPGQTKGTRWVIYTANVLIKPYHKFHPSNTMIKLLYICSCWVQQLNCKVPCYPDSIHTPLPDAPVGRRQRVPAPRPHEAVCTWLPFSNISLDKHRGKYAGAKRLFTDWKGMQSSRRRCILVAPSPTLVGDSGKCPYCSLLSWGYSLALAALILEQSPRLTLPRGKRFPSRGSWQDTWGASSHPMHFSNDKMLPGAWLTLPTCSLNLSRLFCTDIPTKLFKCKRGWHRACR